MSGLREVGPELTEETLAGFEKELGNSLPDPYRRFLLRNNGGRPPLGKNCVEVEDLPGDATDVHFFFGINYPLQCYDLRWNREANREDIPEDRLAIASDSGGSEFCISLRESDFGAVLFCDLFPVYGESEVYPGFYPVAPDFDSFLNKLHELPDQPTIEGQLVYSAPDHEEV